MVTQRNFTSTAVATYVTGYVATNATTVSVAALTGYPAVPFTAVIDRGTTSEEVVEVTAVSGLNLTVTRGIDGTASVAHNLNATFEHDASARDFNDANQHHLNNALHLGANNVTGSNLSTSLVLPGTLTTNNTVTIQSGGSLSNAGSTTLSGTTTLSGGVTVSASANFTNASNYFASPPRINGTSALVMAGSQYLHPLTSSLWHDKARWTTPNVIEITSNVATPSWTTTGAPSASAVQQLFAGRTDLTAVQILPANPGLRLTWNSTGWGYGGIQYLVVGATYNGGGGSSIVQYVFESSADGVTWTSRADTGPGGAGTSANWIVLPLADHGGDSYFRLTMLATTLTGQYVSLRTIQLLTARPGDQGAGFQTDLPINWSATRDITVYGSLMAGSSSTGGQVLTLKSGSGDYAYLGLYARAAAQSTQSGYLGYGSSGTTTLTLANSLTNGDVSVTTVGTGALKFNNNAVWYTGVAGRPVTNAAIAFDTITGGSGAGIGNLASQTVDSYNIKDGAVTSSKLAAGAISTTSVATGTLGNTQFSMFRYVASTANYTSTDAAGQPVDNLQNVAGATRVADGQAFGGAAIQATTTGTTSYSKVMTGPFYGATGQGVGLQPGNYRVTFYAKVASSASTSRVVTVGVNCGTASTVVAGSADFTPAQIGSTNYVGIAIPLTVLANLSGTAGLETYAYFDPAAGTTLSISHVTVEPYDAPFQGEITTTYLKDLAVTDAKIASASVSKLIAGTINADDIYMGTGGHVYLGPDGTTNLKTGARIELNSSGIYAYSGTATTTTANTVQLLGSGSFTLQSASSGARLALTNSALNLYDGSGNNTVSLANTGTFTLKAYNNAATPTGSRLVLDSTGLNVYDANSTNTVSLSNAGSFTLQSATSGARLALTTSGLTGYNASGNQTYSLANTGTFTLSALNNAATPTGARVVLDGSAGLRLYDATNTQLASLSPSGTFTLQSGASGARMVMDNTGLNLYDGSANNTVNLAGSTGILTLTYPSGSSAKLALDGTGLRLYNGYGLNTVNLKNDGTFTLSNGALSGTRVVLSGSGLAGFNSSNVQTLNLTGSTFNLQSGTTGSRIVLDATSGLSLYDPSSNRTVWLDPATGNANFTGTVTATGGTIGGFTLSSTALTGNSSSGVISGGTLVGSTVTTSVNTAVSRTVMDGTGINLLAEATTNLVYNASFERSVSGVLKYWTISDNSTASTLTMGQSSDVARLGSYSLKLTESAGGEDDFVYQEIAAKPSTTYTLSAFLYVSSVTAAAYQNRIIGLYDTAGGATAFTTATLSQLQAQAGMWTRYSVTLTTGANAITPLRIRLYAPQGTFYWDDVQVEEKSNFTHFVDGSAFNVGSWDQTNNLLAPGSFASTTENWTGGTWASTSSLNVGYPGDGTGGTNSGSITSTASVSGTVTYTSPMVSVTGGTTYTFSAYAYASYTTGSSRMFTVYVDWYDNSATPVLLSSSSGSRSDGSWTRVFLTAAAPANAYHAKVRVTCGTQAVGDKFYLAAAMFEARNYVANFDDGSSGSTNNVGRATASRTASSPVVTIQNQGGNKFSGTIMGASIQGSSVTATTMSASNILGGTITGSTFQTPSPSYASNHRLTVDNQSIRFTSDNTFNLLTDPGMGEPYAYWTPSSANMLPTKATPTTNKNYWPPNGDVTGSGSLMYLLNQSSSVADIYVSHFVAVKPNTTYTFSAFFQFGDGSKYSTLVLDSYQKQLIKLITPGNVTSVATYDSSDLPFTDFRRYSCTIKTGPSDYAMEIRLYAPKAGVDSAYSSTQVTTRNGTYVDGAQLEESPFATAYVDPNSVGGSGQNRVVNLADVNGTGTGYNPGQVTTDSTLFGTWSSFYTGATAPTLSSVALSTSDQIIVSPTITIANAGQLTTANSLTAAGLIINLDASSTITDFKDGAWYVLSFFVRSSAASTSYSVTLTQNSDGSGTVYCPSQTFTTCPTTTSGGYTYWTRQAFAFKVGTHITGNGCGYLRLALNNPSVGGTVQLTGIRVDLGGTDGISGTTGGVAIPSYVNTPNTYNFPNFGPGYRAKTNTRIVDFGPGSGGQFSGRVTASAIHGSLVTGSVINGSQIIGTDIATSESGARVEIVSGTGWSSLRPINGGGFVYSGNNAEARFYDFNGTLGGKFYGKNGALYLDNGTTGYPMTGAWTAFTSVTITGATTNPTGLTASGAYCVIGNTMFFRIEASGTVGGSPSGAMGFQCAGGPNLHATANQVATGWLAGQSNARWNVVAGFAPGQPLTATRVANYDVSGTQVGVLWTNTITSGSSTTFATASGFELRFSGAVEVSY